jgi:YbbR domain-containing protein
MHNWKVKLASVIFASALWFYVNSFDYVTQPVILTVDYINLPANLTIVQVSDEAIDLDVRARKNIIAAVSFSKEIKAVVDLSEATIGNNDYPVQIRQADPNLDLRITAAKKTVNVTIDELRRKNVLVKPKIVGTPREGFVVDRINTQVRAVRVAGPRGIIELINSVETAQVDITDATNRIVRTVAFQPPDAVSVIDRENVTVEVVISERKINREANFPVILENLSQELEPVVPPQISINLEVPGRFLDNFQNKVRVIADLSTARTPGTHIVPLRVFADDGIEIISETPRNISIELIPRQ